MCVAVEDKRQKTSLAVQLDTVFCTADAEVAMETKTTMNVTVCSFMALAAAWFVIRSRGYASFCS